MAAKLDFSGEGFNPEKKPRYLAWTIGILVLLLAAVMVLKFSGISPDITGRAVADSEGSDFFKEGENNFTSLDTNEDAAASNQYSNAPNSDSNEISADENAESGLASETGSEEAVQEPAKQIMDLEVIKVKADNLALKNYELALSSMPLTVTESPAITIKDSRAGIAILPDASVELESFSGNMAYSSGLLTLTGTITAYYSDTVNIAYDAPEQVEITLAEGNIAMDNIALNFGGIMSGTVSLSDVAAFQLGQGSELYLKQYNGRLSVGIAEGLSTISIDGNAESFHAITSALDIKVT